MRMWPNPLRARLSQAFALHALRPQHSGAASGGQPTCGWPRRAGKNEERTNVKGNTDDLIRIDNDDCG